MEAHNVAMQMDSGAWCVIYLPTFTLVDICGSKAEAEDLANRCNAA